jgi:hypothetical protein
MRRGQKPGASLFGGGGDVSFGTAARSRITAANPNGLGVSWLVEGEQRQVGLFGTLIDPHGN